jgi:TonB family protein
MSLQGDVNTLALSDLVQVSAMNRRTCQIHVMGPHAEGDLFLDRGAVVHAWWGDLVGAEAVYAMLNTPDVGFHVRNDVCIEAHTIAASWQHLVLEAARRSDHGSVPQPRTRSSERWRFDTPAPDVEPILEPPTIVRPRRGPPRVLWMTATALLALSIGMVAARFIKPRTHAPTASASATGSVSSANATASASAVGGNVVVFDASDLTGPGDLVPTLADGALPQPPRSEWAVAPTIVCRLTIGADGRVVRSRVYRSRLDLAVFEDAALAAVERWRFHPGRHAGAPVAVTINWPVTFTAADGAPRARSASRARTRSAARSRPRSAAPSTPPIPTSTSASRRSAPRRRSSACSTARPSSAPARARSPPTSSSRRRGSA